MDRAEELIGRSLGRYRITALVGKGGMATVYKATHPGLGQTVAVKVLHPHMATDPDMLGRFQQEAQAVANLRHPNIVRVLDFDVVDDRYFMVMEYVDGPTLAAQLGGFAAQGERMPTGEVTRILEPLCSAVDYAHGQGMIHRDIKPANVLLTPQGEPVLTDYGIAKMVGVTQHTATGTVMGSAYYMSPEQAQGSGIDGRTDIYSLGVLLFEMLAGRVPYEGDTLATVLVKHITAPVPAVCAFNAQLPPLLDEVMSVALAKDPAMRFQSGAALAAALRQGLAAPAAAPGTTTLERGAQAAAPGAGFTRVEQAPGGQTPESWAARTAARDVYISYATPDKEAAEAVCARLEAEGVSCWIAPRDVLPGRSFAQALSSAIHAARVFVLVFSAATNESQQVERELHMADAAGLPLVPLRVQDVSPHESIEYYLAGRTWVDASAPPLAAHLPHLVENVSLLLLQTPPRLPPRRAAAEATAVEPVAATETTLEPASGDATTAEPEASPGAAGAEPVPEAEPAAPAATTAEPVLTAEPAAPAATIAEPPVAELAAAVVAAEVLVGPAATDSLAAEAVVAEPAAEEPVAAEAAAEAPAAAEAGGTAMIEPLVAPPAAEAEPPGATGHPPATPVTPTTVEAPPVTEPAAEPPGSPRAEPAAAPTPEPPAAEPTVLEQAPAEPPATVEAPTAAEPTKYEAPAPKPTAAPAPVVPAKPRSGERAGDGTPALPGAFRTRALAAAAVVGVLWVVVLFVLDRFVL